MKKLCRYVFECILARSPEYPQVQRIRVASVFEFFVCLFDCSLCVCKFSHFSSFILLFLYSTVQKSAVQYSILERARNDVTTLVYSHIESYEHLYKTHMKDRKGNVLSQHSIRCPSTLISSVWNRGCDNPKGRDIHEILR